MTPTPEQLLEIQEVIDLKDAMLEEGSTAPEIKRFLEELDLFNVAAVTQQMLVAGMNYAEIDEFWYQVREDCQFGDAESGDEV